ncbi:MAG: carbonic anhydrase [Acidimicrobiia bacterium]|nr:carbonic anhydrase [Acidimicrobiia bacterium]
MTSDEAIERLRAGNQRFASGATEAPRRDARRRSEQAEGQTPFAVILGCADSRVPPEILFDQGIGDLFPVRVAGNVAVEDITLGSIEFGVAVLGCPLLMVLGHESCGAVKGAVEGVGGRYLGPLVAPIVPAVDAVRDTAEDIVAAAVDENVRRQVRALSEIFPDVTVVGARYELRTGQVELLTR